MEKQVNTGKGIVTFLLGSALGAGAAFLMSRVCKMKGPIAGATTQKSSGADGETTYCAVPEGADICYPEQ
jgi:uncharacterized protein (DUF697 family)